MVYRNSTTYVSNADWVGPVVKRLRSLRQAPITRVNRQIRNECLHIFYEMFHFLINLNVRSEEVPGEERVVLLPASENKASLQSFREMIQAFTPSPTNMLHISNLRFLSSLTITAFLKGHDEHRGCIGFHMTSAKETKFDSLAVRGLDWNSRDAVLSAWVDAAERSPFREHFKWGMDSTRLGYLANRALVEETVGLLCLIAEHCPQLTRSVSVNYAWFATL